MRIINKIKAVLCNPLYLGELIWRRVFSRIIKNDKLYLQVRYFLCTHKKLHLKNPKLFTEKLQWLKIYNRNPLFTKLVDKYEVKGFIEQQNLDGIKLIPTLGVWDVFDDIDFEKLPNRFVLKCTHDSGGLIICKDKENFDVDYAKKKINHCIKRNYYQWTREWPYKNVTPRIIVEEYMEEYGKTDLTDYKFFCFNGKAQYCQVIADRRTDETIDFYDREWNHQPFIGLAIKCHNATIRHAKPQCYSEMLASIDKLAGLINSPFVRIDLYVINSVIYFGEITFFPGGGNGAFRPKEWNKILGEKIILNED